MAGTRVGTRVRPGDRASSSLGMRSAAGRGNGGRRGRPRTVTVRLRCVVSTRRTEKGGWSRFDPQASRVIHRGIGRSVDNPRWSRAHAAGDRGATTDQWSRHDQRSHYGPCGPGYADHPRPPSGPRWTPSGHSPDRPRPHANRRRKLRPPRPTRHPRCRPGHPGEPGTPGALSQPGAPAHHPHPLGLRTPVGGRDWGPRADADARSRAYGRFRDCDRDRKPEQAVPPGDRA